MIRDFISKLISKVNYYKLIIICFLYKNCHNWGEFGKNVKLYRRILLERPKNIILGQNVTIREDVWLQGGYKNKSIVVEDNSFIHRNCILRPAHGFIYVGKNCSINPFGYIRGSSKGIVIGNNVQIGPRVTMISSNHKFNDLSIDIQKQGIEAKGIVLGNNIWVGTNVTILDGVTIGNGCVIAAGAVVTKSFEENSVIGGVPAKLLKKRGQ